MDRFLYFLQYIQEKGGLLVAATVAAFIFANGALSDLYENFLHSNIIGIHTHIIINDALMAIFFLVVGIEIKKEIVVGHLATKSQRILPIICAISGVVVPLIIYLLFNKGTSNINGWAIPTATDIAFTLAIVSAFSSRIPYSIKIFITALAIIDDLIAVLAIALFYTVALNWYYILGIAACITVLGVINIKQTKYLILYLFIGCITWYCFFYSGIHATVAGVVLGFFIPIKQGEKVIVKLQPIVGYIIMPLFAFYNAGISLKEFSLNHLLEPITLGVMLGLFIGKQIGIFGAFSILIKTQLIKMPDGATYMSGYIASVLCGIGFTMSLFVATLAFNTGSSELMMAKIGIILGSLLSCIYGIFLVIR